jgi:hypothetical protein
MYQEQFGGYSGARTIFVMNS